MLMYEAWKYIKVPHIFVDMSGFCPFKFNTDNCASLVCNGNILFFSKRNSCSYWPFVYILFVFRKTSRGSHQTNILPPALATEASYIIQLWMINTQ